jgi:prepilin-type N-terminal cleavage/methylation domain-containing protein/prepilin-type processing-associated H-X9-DG protein
MFKRKRGFTLVELLVVVAIIAILAAILFPIFLAARARGRTVYCMANLKQFAGAFSMYQGDYESKFPTTTWPGFPGGVMQISFSPTWFTTKMGQYSWPRTIDPYLQKGSIVGYQMKGCFLCKDRERRWADMPMYPDPHSYGYNFLYLGIPFKRWDTKRWDADGKNPYRNQEFRATAPKLGRLRKPAETIVLVDNYSAWAFPPYNNQSSPAPIPGTGNMHIRPRHSGKTNILWADGHCSQLKTKELVTLNQWFGVKKDPVEDVGTVPAIIPDTPPSPGNKLWDLK